MNKQEILNLVESCQELTLPNGVKGAIRKNQLIEEIDKFFDSKSVPQSPVKKSIHQIWNEANASGKDFRQALEDNSYKLTQR